jgi:hypothetical protein
MGQPISSLFPLIKVSGSYTPTHTHIIYDAIRAEMRPDPRTLLCANKFDLVPSSDRKLNVGIRD